jgi:hypothetical protein
MVKLNSIAEGGVDGQAELDMLKVKLKVKLS